MSIREQIENAIMIHGNDEEDYNLLLRVYESVTQLPFIKAITLGLTDEQKEKVISLVNGNNIKALDVLEKGMVNLYFQAIQIVITEKEEIK